MASRSKAEIEKELNACGMQVVRMQKEVSDLEQKRGAAAPQDLEEQLQLKSDELAAAQKRWNALRAEADSAV